MNDAILQSELDTDPEAIGYAAAGWSATPPSPAQYQAVLGLINATARTEDRTEVPAAEVLAAVTPTHYLAVFDDATGNAVHRRYWKDIMASETVDLENPNIRTALTTIFTGRTETLAALAALQTVAISRAKELGQGRVKEGDLRRLKGDVN